MSFISKFFKKDNETKSSVTSCYDIISFRYAYHGSIGGDSYSYDIKVNDKCAVLKIKSMLNDYGELQAEIGNDLLVLLSMLLKNAGIKSWDGFDKYDPDVLDGCGFSLDIRFSDGSSVSASGENSFPDGYRAFKEKLDNLIKPEQDRLYKEAISKKREKGVSGQLILVLANFVQRGDSGYDRYETMFSLSSVRGGNFSLQYKSRNGEFFPKGESSFYGDVPDSELDLDKFDAIIKKYDVVKWMDYEETAEDYNNSEWFQISFSYEDGRINAHGSKHPENYDEFRRAFLTQLALTAEKAEKYCKQ